MRIDLHCPVELISYELLHDDRGKSRAYLKFGNLTAYRVRSINASLYFSAGDNSSAVQKVRFSDLDVPPHGVISLNVPVDVLTMATSLYAVFTRITFDGEHPSWIGHTSSVTDIADPELLTGKKLDRLRQDAGSDAICLPQQRDDCWFCVCGRPNPFRRKTCMRCTRSREEIFARFAHSARDYAGDTPVPAKVERTAGDTPADPKAEMAQLRRKLLRQRRILIRRSITMAIIILLILLGVWFSERLTHRESPESIPPVKIQNHSAL